jgi:Mn2+/Fe2+ NRAMP family transporter
LGAGGAPATLTSVGEISRSFTPVLGETVGHLVFSAGVLGAAMIAAIVASLALAWGVGEIAGYRRSLEYQPMAARWFYGVYAGGVVAAAALVWAVGNLVWLNIAAQVLNAFLMPLVIGFLVILAIRVLPPPHRLKGGRMWVLIGISGVVSTVAVVGGVWGIR